MKPSRLFAVVAVVALAASLGYVISSRGPAQISSAPGTPAAGSSGNGAMSTAPAPVATAQGGSQVSVSNAAAPTSEPGKSPAPIGGAPVPQAMQNSAGKSPAQPQTETADSKSGPPTAEQVRDEVARDPEAPSKAVLRFSVGLETKMQPALQSEKSAGDLFPELDRCASNSGTVQVAESARALCLSDASRLADKYPDLKPRYENLETRTDPRVVKMKKMMDLK